MAHPLALTPRPIQERDDLVVCRSPFEAHVTFGARVDHASTPGNAGRLLRVLTSTATQAPLHAGRSSRSTTAALPRASETPTAELGRLRIGYAQPGARFLPIDLGDRRGRVLALLRACGLRFRDGSRWRLPAMIQLF
ncbi:hypothetical protein AB0J94_05630 [Micromonospora noduli]|uniref:hypothetical protein n=1 Tax=Micromonospora noduli TaxID=709876 RepID=UPI0034278DFB